MDAVTRSGQEHLPRRRWRSRRPTSAQAYLDGAVRRRCRPAPRGRGAAAAHHAGRQLPRVRQRHRPASATVDEPTAERPGTVIGPYKLLEQIGEGGMGVVFMAEQTAAGPPQGGPEDHQAGHGHAAGHRPLRGRAAGPGADGPSQHRQGPRRRRRPSRAGRTSSWSWSAACRSPSTATRTSLTHPRAAGAVRARLPGGAARPPEGDHPPRPQAVERAGHAARRHAGAQGDRLRHRQGDRASS